MYWTDTKPKSYHMYGETCYEDGYSHIGLNPYGTAYIRPCFLLREDIVILSGDGTKDDPYILGKKVFEDVPLEEATITFGNISWRNGGANVKISTNAKYTIEYQVGSTSGTWQKAILAGEDVRVSNLKHGDVVYARLRKGTNTGNHATLTIADAKEPKDAIIILDETSVELGTSIIATVNHIDKQSGIEISNCKWVLNTNPSYIGTDSSYYTGGTFSNNEQTITLNTTIEGTFYLHILSVDKAGNAKETISEAITIRKADVVEIGDYVKYIPDTASMTSSLFAELGTYSGSGSNTSSTLTQEELNWRILDIIEEDGEQKIRLISEAPTVSKLYLKGYNGYNNGVYLIDKACETLYNNIQYADDVQNLKYEDVEKYYNTDTYVFFDYNTFNSQDMTVDYFIYPSMLLNEVGHKVNGSSSTGILSRSEQEQLINQSEELQANSLTVTGINGLAPFQMINNNVFKDDIYMELLGSSLKSGRGNWLSSRTVAVNENNLTYGIWSLTKTSVYGDYATTMYSTQLHSANYDTEDQRSRESKFSLLPVVTLKSNVSIDSTNSGDGSTPEEAYVLKIQQ